jgi:hypothetical protein
MSPCDAKIPAFDSQVGGNPFALLSTMCAYVEIARDAVADLKECDL